MDSCSHWLQKRDRADNSQAFRLPIRAQNMAAAALMTVAVAMRGSGRRSVIGATKSCEKPKTFSA